MIRTSLNCRAPQENKSIVNLLLHVNIVFETLIISEVFLCFDTLKILVKNCFWILS